MLIGLENVTVSQGGVTVLDHVDFYVDGTEKIAIVGPNGAGKSTLLSVLCGELTIDRDDKRTKSAVSTSRRITVSKLNQTFECDTLLSVREIFAGSFFNSNQNMGVLADGFDKNLELTKYKDNQDTLYYEFELECTRMMTGLGFLPEDMDKPIGDFSGGQQTKLFLICTLLKKPDLLLLDEPTNHLDLETVIWLEDYLKTYKRAVVIVSHDRYFLDSLADVIYELADGKLTRYVGNYSAYRKQKEKNYELSLKAWNRYLEEKNRLDDLIKRFKNKPTKASMARAKKMQLERMTKINNPGKPPVHYRLGEIVPAVLGPKWVYEAEHLGVGYDRKLFEAGLRIRRGAKIAVLGVNGSGKTALLKTIAEKIPALSGRGMLGNQVLLGFYDQRSADDIDSVPVFEHFHSMFPQMLTGDVYNELAAWGFDGSQANQNASSLSGGEKAKLILAELLHSKPNFLILDEPTNHLDIEAKELIEEAFLAYKGTLLFVSHDRYFINRVAQSLLIIDKDEIYYYPFGYESYLEKKNKSSEQILPGQLRAEDAARIEALRAVPKRERVSLTEEPTQKSIHDYETRLNLLELMDCISEYENMMLNVSTIADWDAAEDYLTQAYLSWYDKYLLLHEAQED